MLSKLLNKRERNKGFTLIELLLVLPLISIIFGLTYTIIFMTNKSFHSTQDKFSTYEDIRIFQINIQKEANQARKSTENDDVMKKSSNKEIHIYTDIDDDNIPEIVKYELKDNKIIKEIKKTTSKVYPYEYNGNWLNKKIVLKNVKDTNFVNEIKDVKNNNSINQSIKDFRKKTTLDLNIITKDKDETIDLEILLVTKSRAEAD